MGELRRFHELTENKTNQTPRYVIYCDSESRVREDGKHIPYLISACFSNRRFKEPRDLWKDYTGNIVQFWIDVAKFGESQKRGIYVFAHNIGYDVINTAAIPSLTKIGYRVTSWFDKGSTYIMNLRHDDTGKKLILVSSTNYYAAKLEKLGELFGIPKLEVDFNTDDIPTMKKYCRRDVLILKTAMEHFFDFIKKEDLGTFARTVPGQSFNAFRHRFMRHSIFIHANEQALELERESYYGGRTECFYVGELKGKNYYSYDVNSMYPAVMKYFPYPVKLLAHKQRIERQEAHRLINEGYGITARVHIQTQEPIYPVRINENLVFPVGDFITYLSTEEIRNGLIAGHVKRIYEVNIYAMDYIFAPYVDYFYNMRLNCKKNGDKIHDFMYKLFLNSLYGKFGQKAENWERVGDADIHDIRAMDIITEDGDRRFVKIFGGSVFEKMEETESYNSFPAIAAHVTANARLLLTTYFKIAGWNNVMYCDTDSLFTNDQGKKYLDPYISETILGRVKLEKQSQYLKIRCPKDYIFGKEEKLKGVRPDAEKLNENTFKSMTFPKLNTFIRAGTMASYYNIPRVKKLKRVYTKGIVKNTGNVKPFHVKTDFINNYIVDSVDKSQYDELKRKFRGFLNAEYIT